MSRTPKHRLPQDILPGMPATPTEQARQTTHEILADINRLTGFDERTPEERVVGMAINFTGRAAVDAAMSEAKAARVEDKKQ